MKNKFEVCFRCKFGFFLACVLILPCVAYGQYEILEPGVYLNEYRINGEKPKVFRDLGGFVLEAPPDQDPSELPKESNGNVLVSGKLILVSGRRFPFVSARLIHGKSGAFEELEFTTKAVHGVYFTFSGRFLSHPKQERLGGDYTVLRGILTKYKNGRRVGYADLPFYEFSFM
jgi:hypothetical protein